MIHSSRGIHTISTRFSRLKCSKSYVAQKQMACHEKLMIMCCGFAKQRKIIEMNANKEISVNYRKKNLT